jgi:hypothetical protein
MPLPAPSCHALHDLFLMGALEFDSESAAFIYLFILLLIYFTGPQ